MIAVALLAAMLSHGQVTLRGGGEVVDAPVVRVSASGVEVGGTEPRVISWDSVRHVAGDHSEAAEQFRTVSEAVWRARLRLARGDGPLALPLFAELFEEYRRVQGPTSLVVNEGLLKCRLTQHDRVGALEPWLVSLTLRRAGWRIAGDPPMLPVIDEATGLVPELPPFWSSQESAAVQQIPTIDMDQTPDADPIVESMRRMYILSVRSNISSSDLPDSHSHPGIEFLRDLMLMRDRDEPVRRAARDRVRGGLAQDVGTWREAWRRYAIGTSLLAEEDEAERTRGLVELLHLPARFGRAQPYLAGLALGELAQELDRRGDRSTAAELRDERRRLYSTALAPGLRIGPEPSSPQTHPPRGSP